MKSLKLVLMAVLIIITTQLNTAQNKNNIFAELYGSGGVYSINYERHIIDNFSIRVGFGPGGEEFTGAPFLLNYYINIDGSNFVGLGLGASYLKFDLPFKKSGEEVGRLTFYDDVYMMANIFFRIQAESGLNFRISFTPFYDHNEEEIQPWGGFGIGYSF